MATRHLEPFELGIAAVDLKAIATTQYATGVLDVRDDFAFTAVVKVVNVGGGAAGAAKLTVQQLAKDKVTVVHSVDILTTIVTNTAGTTRNVVKWGYGTTPTLNGLATLDTVGAEVMALVTYIKVILEIVTANNGTTSVGSIDLFLEHV